MKQAQLKSFFKTNTSAISMGVESGALIALGFLLLFSKSLLISAVNLLLFATGVVLVLSQLIHGIHLFFTKPKIQCIPPLLRSGITAGIVLFLFANTNRMWSLLPMAVGFTAFLTGITNAITFWQYRKEASVRKLSQLIAAVLNLAFGIWIFASLASRIHFSLNILGIYFLLYGLMTLFDCIDALVSPRRKAKIKRRVRITMPLLIAALIPRRVMGSINEYFHTAPDIPLSDAATKDVTPNVEVFVHVTEKGFGAIGHVDMAVNGHVISYGGYDEKSMKLFGSVGPGVLFEVENAGDYIQFCKQESGKTLFAFGIHLSDSEIHRLLEEVEHTKSISVPWTPPMDGLYAGRLVAATGASLYKVQSGPFHYYFVLGQNCVKYADHLLRVSGTAAVLSGIISPGTYYDYLTKEFYAPAGCVITRNVYR